MDDEHQGIETVDELINLVREETRANTRAEIQNTIDEKKSQRKLLADYPGIENPQSPLHKWTKHYLNTDFKGNVKYAEYAADAAARRLGILSKSMQSKAQPRPKIKQSRPEDTLTASEVELAKRWGQDLKDLAAQKNRRQ